MQNGKAVRNDGFSFPKAAGRISVRAAWLYAMPASCSKNTTVSPTAANCLTASKREMEEAYGTAYLHQRELEAMKKVDIRTVDIDTLRDIRDVKINTDLPKEERILDFIRQIGNPYCYRHGKYVVKISFTDTDVTLEQRMLSYLRSKC